MRDYDRAYSDTESPYMFYMANACDSHPRLTRRGRFCPHHGASKIREYSVRQDDKINNQHFISIKLQISNNI